MTTTQEYTVNTQTTTTWNVTTRITDTTTLISEDVTAQSPSDAIARVRADRYVVSCTPVRTMTYHTIIVPPVFFDDTVNCMCFRDDYTAELTGTGRRAKMRVTMSSRDIAELDNRAEHYASEPEYELGIRASARATIAALAKQVDISDVYAEAKLVSADEAAGRDARDAARALYVPTAHEALCATLLASGDATDLMHQLRLTDDECEALYEAAAHIVQRYGMSIVRDDADRTQMLMDVYRQLVGMPAVD